MKKFKLFFALFAMLALNVGNAWGAEVTFDPASDKTFPKDGVTLSLTDGTLTNGTDYRVYKNQTMTISSANGTITNIALTYKSASYDGGGWASSYQPNADSWTSPTASGEQARITKIVVTYTPSAGGGEETAVYLIPKTSDFSVVKITPFLRLFSTIFSFIFSAYLLPIFSLSSAYLQLRGKAQSEVRLPLD